MEINDSAIVTEEFIYEIKDALTPECHASTVEVSNGIVVASWFGGTEEKMMMSVFGYLEKLMAHGPPPLRW